MTGTRIKLFSLLAVLFISLLLFTPAVVANTYYVPDDFATIQAALNGAVAGDEVIVRDGTYTGTGNRNLNFLGKAITLRSENGAAACIIDAEGSESSAHFVVRFVDGETNSSIMDGFTITGGYYSNGAGVYCHNGSPTIANCIIRGNTATGSGGGIYCYFSSPVIINCVVSDNTSTAEGGGLYFWYLSPQIRNCTMRGNSSAIGGGIRCVNCSPTIINSILWNDSAPAGAEIHLTNAAHLIVSYSDVEGGQAGAYVGSGCTLTWGDGNIDEDPLFAGVDDFHLTALSPCVEAGTDAGVYDDIDDEARPQFAGFDIGADEYPELSAIQLSAPENEVHLTSAPIFSWGSSGGVNNVFAVDIAFSPSGPIYSTQKDLHLLIHEPTWTMPAQIWNMINSGRTVYWRVRGADLDAPPVDIVTSGEVWSFTKD